MFIAKLFPFRICHISKGETENQANLNIVKIKKKCIRKMLYINKQITFVFSNREGTIRGYFQNICEAVKIRSILSTFYFCFRGLP